MSRFSYLKDFNNNLRDEVLKQEIPTFFINDFNDDKVHFFNDRNNYELASLFSEKRTLNQSVELYQTALETTPALMKEEDLEYDYIADNVVAFKEKLEEKSVGKPFNFYDVWKYKKKVSFRFKNKDYNYLIFNSYILMCDIAIPEIVFYNNFYDDDLIKNNVGVLENIQKSYLKKIQWDIGIRAERLIHEAEPYVYRNNQRITDKNELLKISRHLLLKNNIFSLDFQKKYTINNLNMERLTTTQKLQIFLRDIEQKNPIDIKDMLFARYYTFPLYKQAVFSMPINFNFVNEWKKVKPHALRENDLFCVGYDAHYIFNQYLNDPNLKDLWLIYNNINYLNDTHNQEVKKKLHATYGEELKIMSRCGFIFNKVTAITFIYTNEYLNDVIRRILSPFTSNLQNNYIKDNNYLNRFKQMINRDTQKFKELTQNANDITDNEELLFEEINATSDIVNQLKEGRFKERIENTKKRIEDLLNKKPKEDKPKERFSVANEKLD